MTHRAVAASRGSAARSARRLLAMALLATALGGCRSLTDRMFRQPTVAFRGLSIEALGLGGGTIAVLVSVGNPNPYALEAREVRYELLTDEGTPVGTGDAAGPFRVPGRDSLRVQLPVRLDWRALQHALGSAVGRRAVAYELRGTLVVVTPVLERTVAYDARGRYALPTLPF